MICLDVYEIQLLRAERMLTLKQLAKKAGMNQQNLSVILRRGTCRVISAGRIAAAFGIPVERIIDKRKDR